LPSPLKFPAATETLLFPEKGLWLAKGDALRKAERKLESRKDRSKTNSKLNANTSISFISFQSKISGALLYSCTLADARRRKVILSCTVTQLTESVIAPIQWFTGGPDNTATAGTKLSQSRHLPDRLPGRERSGRSVCCHQAGPSPLKLQQRVKIQDATPKAD
jgi:hypothetical protein